MYLARLGVSHCRNLTDVDLSLSPRLNLLTGPNGAGKTSVLEAVHVLARGRSFRTSRIGPAIAHGEAAMIVRAEIRDERRGRVSVAVQRQRNNQTEAHLNGETTRTADIAALLPIQLMLPDAAALVFGEPALRRRYLDWGTFHVKHGYLDALRSYQRALRQRNTLLRAAHGDVQRVRAELDIWTHALAEHGAVVNVLREEYVARLGAVLPEILARLAPELAVTCELQRGWPEGMSLRDCMSESLPRDVKSTATQTGPHRADLKLLVAGGPAGATLSRGQAKLLASALHLTQARLTADDAGRTSIFLIDDLGAELDREHNLRFFRILAETESQVLATSTSAPDLGGAFESSDRRMFHVEHGRAVMAADS
jgi:DNA replication and repair protein RecF